MRRRRNSNISIVIHMRKGFLVTLIALSGTTVKNWNWHEKCKTYKEPKFWCDGILYVL